MIWKYKNIEALSLFFFLLMPRTASFAQIIVSPAQAAQALAQKLAGEGVTILNPSLRCPVQANGFFNVTNSNIGLDSGIVLTTGRAATLGSSYGINGNATSLASTDNGAAGDASLNALAGQTTVDACDLEFDVVPTGTTIKFNYVFSSEEYKNSVCGPYNDAFAFLISGPGISGAENMALVPGTDIPVTINSINNGVPGVTGNIRNCQAMGAGSPFTAWYIDNSTGTTLTHQGFTKVLQAIHTVTPCGTYHLKIVIADAGDPLYDSGVFLAAGSLQTSSFSVSAISPGVPGASGAFCVKGCLPGLFRIKRSLNAAAPQTIKFITTGSAISGVDYAPVADSIVIPANDTIADLVINGLPTPLLGTKELKLFIQSPYSCIGVNNLTDSASLYIYDTMAISMITHDTTVCGHDSVLLQVNGNDFFTFSWSPADKVSNPVIKDPIAFPSVNTTYVVTASLPGTACPSKTATVKFAVKLTPDIEIGLAATVCYNAPYQFSAATADSNRYYSYKWSGPDGYTSTLLSPTIDNFKSQPGGLFTISVINDTNGCKDVASVDVDVNTPGIPIVQSPVICCLNSPATALSAKGENLLWYNGEGMDSTVEAPVPAVNEIAVYNYYVSQTINNCESPKAQIEVAVKKCCDGNIFIPSAFTPNGDGRNDKFEPIVDYGYSINTMYVFNRWGQVVYSGAKGVWDGTFGGRPAETGTYFYNISLECILGGTVEKKGDLTLIR